MVHAFGLTFQNNVFFILLAVITRLKLWSQSHRCVFMKYVVVMCIWRFGSLSRALCSLLPKHKLTQIFPALWVFAFLADTWKSTHSPHAHINIGPFRELAIVIKKATREYSQKHMQYRLHEKLYFRPENFTVFKDNFANNEIWRSGPK